MKAIFRHAAWLSVTVASITFGVYAMCDIFGSKAPPLSFLIPYVLGFSLLASRYSERAAAALCDEKVVHRVRFGSDQEKADQDRA